MKILLQFTHALPLSGLSFWESSRESRGTAKMSKNWSRAGSIEAFITDLLFRTTWKTSLTWPLTGQSKGKKKWAVVRTRHPILAVRSLLPAYLKVLLSCVFLMRWEALPLESESLGCLREPMILPVQPFRTLLTEYKSDLSFSANILFCCTVKCIESSYHLSY